MSCDLSGICMTLCLQLKVLILMAGEGPYIIEQMEYYYFIMLVQCSDCESMIREIMECILVVESPVVRSTQTFVVCLYVI